MLLRNCVESKLFCSDYLQIYAQLEEPDGVDGVTALQQNEPSVEQRILALEVSGKLADATTFYEQMMQPLKLQHIRVRLVLLLFSCILLSVLGSGAMLLGLRQH